MEGEVLVRDVHPAELLLADGRVERELRVFVTSRRLLAYRGRHTIEKVLEVDMTSPCSVPPARGTLSANERLECMTSDGRVWLNRERGCGCGFPALKALSVPVGWTA